MATANQSSQVTDVDELFCRVRVEKHYGNQNDISVALEEPTLVSLKDSPDVANDTRLLWAKKVIEAFQSSTEPQSTIRPWDFLLSLDGSVQSLTVPKTDGDHHKTYPTRFQIPTNSLLGLNQEQQLKRAEVFALGSLLYEIISGSVPFENLSDDEVQLRYS
ncbi:MAG: hypothetical protein M1830_005916, partial [Pleopsidium flavum]